MLGQSSRSTTIWASAFIVLSCLTSAVIGLSTSPGSPCEDVCHRTSRNTTSNEIVCKDQLFSSTTKGSNFEQCVECQLNSDYVDPESRESDVNWGLCMLTRYDGRSSLTACQIISASHSHLAYLATQSRYPISLLRAWYLAKA